MPAPQGKPRGPKGQRSHYDSTEGNGKKRKKGGTRQAPTFRKAYRGNTIPDNSSEEDRKKLDDKLLEEVSDCLHECSRQRLRAVHMSMRQYGNEASRISSKDVITSLQENSVKLHDRIIKTLTEKFEDSRGIIDLEALYKFLVDAHSKTGRDSVQAMRKRNDLTPRYDVSQEEIDEDLIWRIEALLIKSQSYIDIPDLRAAFQARDSQKMGKIEGSVARQLCQDQQMPVYGALLKNLMKRCDDEKNDKISWPEFISFLETGQRNAWVSCPDLKDIPEKLKNQTPVAPSIIDELSSKTRNTLVNKLRKKASIKKKEPIEPDDCKDGSTTAIENVNKTSEPNNNVQLILLHGPISDNTIREEPYLELDKKDVLTKADSKATVSSVTSGTQIILDIALPVVESKKTDSSKEGQKTVDNIMNALPEKHSIMASEQEAKTDNIPVKDDQLSDTWKTSESNITVNKAGSTVTFKTQDDKEVTFKVPKKYLTSQTIDPPTERLRMLWVYGYRGNDCRKNIHVLADGEILYFMSYIAIIYNSRLHEQKHYKEHTDEIKSIDVHSDRIRVATGQFASRKDVSIQAHIRIWRSDTLQTLHVLGIGEFERAVACLAFSPGKDLLAAVDNSLEKKLTIWNLETGEKQGEEILHTELICDIGFYRKEPETLVTIGKEHINWWKVYPESRTIQSASKPEYEGFLRAKFVICLTFSERGDLITGDSNGTIYIWGEGGNRITNYVKHAHDGPVFTVVCYKGYLFSGGRDGILHCWHFTKNMDATGFLQLPATDGGIRMLQVLDNTLILGTTMNSMHFVTLTDLPDKMPLSDAVLQTPPITQCHYDDLRGLAISPKAETFDVLTAGLDGIICGIDTTTCRAVSKVQFKGNQYLCIAANKTASLVALGTKDGHIHILRHDDDDHWLELINQKLCKERLDVIQISSDERHIATGGQDFCIYLYSQQQKDDGTSSWEYSCKLQGHKGAINGLDWSIPTEENKLVLKSSSTCLEQRFWNPFDKTVIADDNVPTTTKWLTYSCSADWANIGILASKYEVECIDVNQDRTLIVVGDSKACLSVFRYPCVNTGMYCHAYKSHAVVRNVRFTADGRHVVTVGGRDSCLIQWEII